MNEKILVVDFGSQYNQVIVKSLRKLNIYSELVSYKEIDSYLTDPSIKGIILSGGPNSVYQEGAYKLADSFFDTQIPILGVCYGMQYLCHVHGCTVEKTAIGEYGKTKITIEQDPFFNLTPDSQNVFMSHEDSVVKVSDEIRVIANSDNHIAAVKHATKNIYGVQFHLEVDHTEFGLQMLKNFCIEVCQVATNFTIESYFEMIKVQIKEQVGQDHVLCALSGGVDSSVLAKLLVEVVPTQVHFFFVDTGLMRHNEGAELFEVFKKSGIEVAFIDGKKAMFDALAGLTDPEDKRKTIGRVFVELFDLAVTDLKKTYNIKYLAQGTLYSDVIESGTLNSHTIKSHHNVGGLPEEMQFELLEPVNLLFKDEVRKLGNILGLPNSIVMRQPFPGPGLGIRVLGEITQEKVDIVRQATQIMDEIMTRRVEVLPWQYFCVLTDSYSVGVKGDKRVYERVIAVRAVTSNDAMTASFSHIDFDVLNEIATQITNKIDKVSRVVYDITSKPPGTIEWE